MGVVIKGRARFPIMVRIPQAWRDDIRLLEQLPVDDVGDSVVPLGELADLSLEETPPAVEHDNVRRRTFVAANVPRS